MRHSFSDIFIAMPYTIRKQKCKQSDGDSGSYVLSYTDKKGKKHRACHTSREKAQGQIAAIEGPWEADEVDGEEEVMTERLLREMVRELLSESTDKVIDVYYNLVATEYSDGFVPVSDLEDDMDIEINTRDPKLTRIFEFYIDSETEEDMMILRDESRIPSVSKDRKGKSGFSNFVRTFLEANPGFVKKAAGQADVRFGLSTGDNLTQEQIEVAIENAGATVSDVIMPGEPGSSSGKYATYRIIDDSGTSVDVVFATKAIRMPPRFDSQGIPTYSVGAEEMQINAMNDALRKVIGPNGVNIQLGSSILKNVGAIVQVGGTPKADAFFAPMKGGKVDISSPVAYISLKNAGSPPQMNQWSGTSKFMDRPEVKSFIDDLKAYLVSIGSAGVMPSGLSCRAESPLSELGSGGLELATKACYGLSYTTGNSGPESVDMIYICPAKSVSLQKVKSGIYEFTGGVSLYGGELPPDDWEPYFYARRGDRNDGGIKKCRIGIFPRDYRPSPEIVRSRSPQRKSSRR